ncbi:MAG: tetratricopeptide repeat protein [Asgard group archaeon]|nr:tetratricopeptide repeat protein [Asgard group archaeon]
MGFYNDFKLIYNVYAKLRDLSNIIIDNNIEYANDLLSFNNLLMNTIKDQLFNKEDIQLYYNVLSFKYGSTCPICNSKKRGLFNKKCPKHSNLTWMAYANKLGVGINKLELLKNRIKPFLKNFYKNFDESKQDILFSCLVTYFIKAKVSFYITGDSKAVTDNFRDYGEYTTVEYLKTLFRMGKVLRFSNDGSYNAPDGDRYRWTTYVIYNFHKATKNWVLKTIVPEIFSIIGENRLIQTTKIKIKANGLRYHGISYFSPDLREFTEEREIDGILDFSIYSITDLERLKTLIRQIHYECTSEELLSDVLKANAPDYPSYLLLKKSGYTDYDEYISNKNNRIITTETEKITKPANDYSPDIKTQNNVPLKNQLQLDILNDIFDYIAKNNDYKMSISEIDLMNPNKENAYEQSEILKAHNELSHLGFIIQKFDPSVGLTVELNQEKLEDIRKFIEKIDDQSDLLEKFDSLFKSHDTDDVYDDEDDLNPDAYTLNCETLLSDISKYKQKYSDTEYLILKTEEYDLYFDINDSQALIDLGFLLYYPMENFDASVDAIKAAIELKPDNYEAYNLLGVIHAMNGDYKQGLIFLKNALELNVNFADAWFNSSIMAEKMNLMNESIDYLKKAINLDPFNEKYKRRAEKLGIK